MCSCCANAVPSALQVAPTDVSQQLDEDLARIDREVSEPVQRRHEEPQLQRQVGYVSEAAQRRHRYVL